MVEKKKRLSNFELMRIVSMFLIVQWHVIQHTNALYNTSYTLNFIISFIFIITSIHVNSFVLVTGYFQYNKKFNYKKVLKLIGQVLFYNVLFVLVDIFIFKENVDLLYILENTSFLNINNYWFINTYLILYLISPFLNKYIEHAEQKEYKRLLIIFFICIDLIPFITRQRTFSNNGLTLIGFIFLYLLGAYFAKYPIKETHFFKEMSKNKRQLYFLCAFILIGILNFVNYRFGLNLEKTSENPVLNSIGKTISNAVIGFNNPFVFLESVMYFLFFETLTIESKLINKISAATFGIYLAHENRVIFTHVYDMFLGKITETTTCRVLPKMLLFAVILFTAGLIIELTRKLITYLLCKLKPVQKMTNKIYNYIENF